MDVTASDLHARLRLQNVTNLWCEGGKMVGRGEGGG